MELQEKNRIYSRLLEISMKMETKTIPDPRYISEKIGLCHIHIEEVEKFFIQISQEMSVVQRALNDAEAAYENAKDNLIANDEDIKILPSLKDREAKANQALKDELSTIKSYQNEYSDLENLQKAVTLKLKNLTRLNTDIKMQLRLMESQIKLGSPHVEDSAAKSLAEELSRSTVGADIFEDMETKAEEISTVDPSEPLNVNSLLTPQDDLSTILTPVETPEEVMEEPEETVEEEDISEKLLDPVPIDPMDDISSCMPGNTTEEEKETGDTVIDLDKVLMPVSNPTPLIGGEQKDVKEPENPPVESSQKETQKTKNPDDIDVDALLSQWN